MGEGRREVCVSVCYFILSQGRGESDRTRLDLVVTSLSEFSFVPTRELHPPSQRSELIEIVFKFNFYFSLSLLLQFRLVNSKLTHKDIILFLYF